MQEVYGFDPHCPLQERKSNDRTSRKYIQNSDEPEKYSWVVLKIGIGEKIKKE